MPPKLRIVPEPDVSPEQVLARIDAIWPGDRAVAEASLDSGPSSAEVVANQIASALASQRAAALDGA